MTPYYEDDHVTIYHGDCREVLPEIVGGGRVSTLIADPPYGDTSLDWDTWPDGWVRSMTELTEAPQMWCFGSMRMFMARAAEFVDAGWTYGQEVVWEKHNGSSFHADRFKRVHEFAMHWYQGAWSDLSIEPQMTADATRRAVRRKERPAHTGHIGEHRYLTEDGGPRMQRSVIYARSCHGHATNETQKPEAIVRPLIGYSAPIGTIVLDPFMGSGTTLVVARSMNRKAIGIERREEQCEHAARRLSQGTLDFGGAA